MGLGRFEHERPIRNPAPDDQADQRCDHPMIREDSLMPLRQTDDSRFDEEALNRQVVLSTTITLSAGDWDFQSHYFSTAGIDKSPGDLSIPPVFSCGLEI